MVACSDMSDTRVVIVLLTIPRLNLCLANQQMVVLIWSSKEKMLKV